MNTKVVPTIFIICITIGVLLLATKFLSSSINIISITPSMPGVKIRRTFFQKPEAQQLQIKPDSKGIYTLKVSMFSNNKFSMPEVSDYNIFVSRMTSRQDVITYSIEQIIIGPTQEEINDGLRPTIGLDAFASFNGVSKCDNKDFVLSLDSESMIVNIEFCRDVIFYNDSASKIIIQQIKNTLNQFSKIRKIQIFNREGNCINNTRPTSPEDCVI